MSRALDRLKCWLGSHDPTPVWSFVGWVDRYGDRGVRWRKEWTLECRRCEKEVEP